MIKYSVNPKLNRYMLKIQEQLMRKGETLQEALAEIRRYKESFPHEPDYKLAQHGGMCVGGWEVKELMESCGYTPTKLSNEQIWDNYLRSVGYVARVLLKRM